MSVLCPLPSLRSKRFQSSYCTKVRAGAKKKKVEGGGSRSNFLDELARKHLLRRQSSTSLDYL